MKMSAPGPSCYAGGNQKNPHFFCQNLKMYQPMHQYHLVTSPDFVHQQGWNISAFFTSQNSERFLERLVGVGNSLWAFGVLCFWHEPFVQALSVKKDVFENGFRGMVEASDVSKVSGEIKV